DLPGYFTTDVWSYIIVNKSNYYRPIFLVWMMLNSKFFGLDTGLWHASAIALHLLAVALFYFLARKLSGSTIAAGIAALLFGVHPVHVEAVAWISGATESLFAVLGFGTLLCYLRSRDPSTPDSAKPRWSVSAAVLYALCIFSKETAIVLPALIAAYELLFPRTAAEGLFKRLRGALAVISPLIAISALYVVARIHALGAFEPLARLWTRRMVVGTLPSVAWFYVQHLLLPWRYSIFYPIGPVTDFDFASFWGPLAAVV